MKVRSLGSLSGGSPAFLYWVLGCCYIMVFNFMLGMQALFIKRFTCRDISTTIFYFLKNRHIHSHLHTHECCVCQRKEWLCIGSQGHLCGDQRTTCETGSIFHHMWPGDQTPVIRCRYKCLHSLSYLVGSFPRIFQWIGYWHKKQKTFHLFLMILAVILFFIFVFVWRQGFCLQMAGKLSDTREC